jgi:hypothetical protein
MRSIFFSIISFLFAILVKGQTTPDAFMFTPGAQSQQIIPQSPEAGNLGRYGSIPITSATGQMSYSIPFYNIEIDGHNWPVGLNYNYGGLLLEGKPSIMGLGWNLQAEAAVTREIRGLADEHQHGYNSDHLAPTEPHEGRTVRQLINDYTYHEFNDGNPNNSGLDTWTIQTLRKFRDGFYDAEPDKYTVNISGVKFSFKINLDLPPEEQVYFLSKHSNKVQVLWSSNRNSYTDSGNYEIEGFIVTDDKGIKYRFDIIENSEPQGRDNVFYLNPTTAWKLREITYLNNQKITFGYTPNTISDYNFRVVASAILTNVSGLSPNPNGYQPSPIQPGNAIYSNPQYGDEISVGSINRNVLTSISFPKGHIDLSFNTERNLYESFELFDNLTATTSVKKFEFSHSGNRNLLNDITFNGQLYYQFEYHNEVTIPDHINSVEDRMLARKQDLWKFYNGASNEFALNLPNSQINGVNRNPSLLHSRLGALKRIIYPTKGSTNIYYEQNQIESDFDINDTYLRSLPPGKRFFLELDAQVDNVTHKTKKIEILQPTVAVVSHYINGDRSGYGIDLELKRTDGEYNYTISFDGVTVPPYPGANDFYYDVAPYLRQKLVEYGAHFTIPPMYPVFAEQFGYADTDDGQGNLIDTINRTTGDKILIMPGIYEMNITVGSLGANVRGSITMQMYGAFNEPFPDRINNDIGGIRVDYTKDCPDSFGDNCFITDYNYNDEEGFSTGVQYLIPQLKTFYTLDQINLPGENTTPGALYRTQIVTYTENPFTVNDPLFGTPVFYEKITTTKRKNGSVNLESNAEIGKIETRYSLPMDNITDFFPRHPTGVDLDKSLPLETYFFEQGIEQYISLNKNTYFPTRGLLGINYNQDIDNRHPWGLKVHINKYRYVNYADPDYSVLNPTLGTTADLKLKALHGIKAYRELDIWNRLTSTTSEVDGVSKRVLYRHNENYKVIEEEITDSRGNVLLKETQYANEAGLSDMEAINQLSTPVLVKNYYDGILQSTQKTEFILNELGYKPSKVFTAKGNSDLEAKVQFSYHNNGKLKQVDQLLDSPDSPGEGNEIVLKSTAYVWGYNNEYPVVKVDNATYNKVETSNANLNILRNSTSALVNKKNELRTLRNDLPNAFVYGYTYEPLVGISNIIDSRGYTTSYEYENLNRLKEVKDEQEKIVEEYLYKYRSENYANPDAIGQYSDLGGNINGPDEVDFGTTLTYIVNPTGGSEEYGLAWYKDDIFLTSGVVELDISFSSGSSSVIRVDVTDNVTGNTFSIIKTVTVNIDIGTVSLEVLPSPIGMIGDTFTINSSGINQNLGSLSYAWFVDNSPTAEAFTGASGFPVSFLTPGSHTVKLVVTHNESNNTSEAEIPISVLEPLPALTLNANNNFILTNTPVTFTPTDLGNTHGIIQIDWFIDGPSGTQNLSYNGDQPYTHTFNTPGEYTVRFVVEAALTDQIQEASTTVNVTAGLNIGEIQASTQNILVNTPVTFTMPTISGGSGNYQYAWIVQNNVESNNGQNFTYNGFNSTNAYYIKLQVTDTSLNQTQESPPVRIDVWRPIFTPTIETTTNPIYTDEAVIFTALTGGGSGNRSTQWFKKFENNAEVSSGTVTSLQTSFNAPGTYRIRAVISDGLIANHQVENFRNFEVYNRLNVGNITASTTNIIRGSSITFTAPAITGGSNNKRYEWIVNNTVRSTSSGNFTYNQFNTAGNYTIKFRVIDNDLGVTKESTIIVNVYNPLNDPVFTQYVNHIEVGNDLYTTLTNLGAGFETMQFKWFVKFNSGSYSVISGATGYGLNYNSFNSVGTYTIKLRVTHANVPSHYKETSKVVNVYSPIQISDSDISTPSPVSPNTSTYFNINSASGGSGSFEYEWDVINISSNHTEGLARRSEANRNVPSFNISDLFIGNTKIQCRVHDLNTNKYKTVSKTITVNSYGPLTAPRITSRDTDNDPESASYRLSASATGGSGQYRFRWVINNVVVQESDSNTYQYVTLNCSNQTAVVKCVVIDKITGVQAGPRTLNLSIGNNCGNQH